ncbi:hypothetical protein [Skermania piniformis]|uniref:DUF2746 domain-containing protein n=1 Tax=Skermania pinensis TaxID=39122 RepID=A0ABX8SBK1_9ACTN|nr:hypothetical protein [Skermania piniformis]QXQ14831.1 hypothetical protein KV203_05470 [Skermania piniformis]
MGEVGVSIGDLAVGGGVFTVVAALIAAVVGWRRGTANVAEVAARLTHSVAEDLRADIAAMEDKHVKETDRLEARIVDFEVKLDDARDQIATLTVLLRTAIPLLRAAGHVAEADEMSAAVRRRVGP